MNTPTILVTGAPRAGPLPVTPSALPSRPASRWSAATTPHPALPGTPSGPAYRDWSARGATFLTEPKDHGYEIRAYIRDPDGHLIEVGQIT
jgi:catechol 2,3-dioxygenase-like lactoylglutathione lyase family enzyme